eukprot:1320561-Rhodomonas_salina.2
MRPGDVSLGMRSWTRLLFVCLVGCLSQASQLSSARETSLLQTRILRPAFASALLVPQAKQPNVCNSRHCFTRNPVFPHKASSTALQAKKAKGKTKKDRQQEGEGLQRKESQVLAAAKEAGTGFESDPQAVEKLVGLLEELEECNGAQIPPSLSPSPSPFPLSRPASRIPPFPCHRKHRLSISAMSWTDKGSANA